MLYIVVECGGLEDPANGTVEVPATTYQSVASYSCDTGYNLTGEGMQTCLSSGEWSLTTPNCSGIAYIHSVSGDVSTQ